jgi:hypothetical protein
LILAVCFLLFASYCLLLAVCFLLFALSRTGKFQMDFGARSCSLCPAGQFGASTEMVTCNFCPDGKLQPAAGQSQCDKLDTASTREYTLVARAKAR